MTVTRIEVSDWDLVVAVRRGDESAFEELFRRYHGPIAAYVGRMVRDKARAEDLAQDVFFSALRHLRATDAEIDFKPWIYEIARNATIDHWRRASRTEEVSVDNDDLLRPSDRIRLVGSPAPDSALINKERLIHLQGAFDELGDLQARALVMRELDGKSYREIAEELDVSRSAVESTLVSARQRLEIEYADISEGRRCVSIRAATARLAEGVGSSRDEGRLGRHARRCATCRQYAREMGIEPLSTATRLRRKVGGLVGLPFLEPAVERTAAIVAAIVIAGAGGAVVAGVDPVFGGGGKGDSDSKPADTGAGQDGASKSGAEDPSRGASGESGEGRLSRSEQAARRREARRNGLRGNGAPGAGGSAPQTGAGAPNGSGSPASGGRGGGLPGVPNLPDTPNLPNTPNLPDLPDLPGGLPNLPDTPNLPNLPNTPNLPSTPSLPGGAPSLPSTPQLPPTPPVQTPQLPQAPPVTLPSLPQAPLP